jgi:glycosyltransferase involved in cell wall biosynthesis
VKVTWSVPVFSQGLDAGRGDLVRARALIDALRSRGWEVQVVEARDRPGREIEESIHRRLAGRVLPGQARLALRDAARWWRSRGHGRRVARAAREQGADMLVETQVHGVVSGWLASRATGLPLVLDDVSPPAEAARLGAGLPFLARASFDRQRESAELLVAPSTRVLELVNGVDPNSTSLAVIPNGVDLAAHRQADRASGRRALGVEEEVVIAFAGSFQPWHATGLLVRAAAALETVAFVRLLLLGDGPERGPALEEARGLGIEDRIVAPGSVPPGRVPELLAGCDVAVLPGTNDYGHPMKLLEYAAAGLPTVAPDVPSVREMVEDGLPAVLFPEGDVAGLTGALERLMASPGLRRCLGGHARRRVAREMDWDALGERLERELRRAMDGYAGTVEPGRGPS